MPDAFYESLQSEVGSKRQEKDANSLVAVIYDVLLTAGSREIGGREGKLYREFFDRCSRAGFAGAHELGRLPKRVFDIDSEKWVVKFPIHANYYNDIKNAINIRY